MCATLMHLFVFLCLQCAGRASTNPPWGIWSVQSARLIASLTMRGRCTVAVRGTTSVLRETLRPWPVPVSVLLYHRYQCSYLIYYLRSF